MNSQSTSQRLLPKWLSPIFFVFLLYAVFFLPFWKPLLLAFLFACAGAPLVNYIHKRNQGTSKKATSLILMAVIIISFLLLLTIGGIRIYGLLYDLFQNPEEFSSRADSLQTVRTQIVQWMKNIPFIGNSNVERQFDMALSSFVDQAKTLVGAMATAFVVKTPEILMNLFIFILALGVFLVWGPRKWTFISKFMGRENTTDCEDFFRFEKICAISIGSIFLTGIIQATIVSVGAAFSGYPLFLCFLFAFIFSLIPVLGAGLVPTLLAILSYANGSTSGAIIMLVTAIIAGTSDNIVRAWLFSRAANTNPIVSLLALFGGITLFGFTGLFLAPVVEQLVMSYLERKPPQPLPVKQDEPKKKFAFRAPPQPQT